MLRVRRDIVSDGTETSFAICIDTVKRSVYRTRRLWFALAPRGGHGRWFVPHGRLLVLPLAQLAGGTLLHPVRSRIGFLPEGSLKS